MCIICISEAGKEMPSEKEIRHMFSKNPDGAGFAIQGDIDRNGSFKLIYRKGFMTIDDFLEALGPLDKLKDLTVAMHFRIKTHGEKDAFTTHPFPLSKESGTYDKYGHRVTVDFGDVRSQQGQGVPILFHNGVIAGLGGKADSRSSDTQDFVMGFASQMLYSPNMPGKLKTAITAQLLGACRVLIMYPSRKFPFIRFGQWYEHNGNWYSNSGYLDEDEEKTYTTLGSCHYHAVKPNYKHEELDEWGCNIAEYAWPDDTGWLRVTPERFKLLMDYAKEVKHEYQTTTCKFTATGDTIWYVNEDKCELYTMDRMNDVYLREDEEEYLYDIQGDGESWLAFDNENQMLDFCKKADKKLGNFKYKYGGKVWYLNCDDLEAYTEKGIKELWKPGQSGHVLHYLEKEGGLSAHPEYREYEGCYDDELEEEVNKAFGRS